MSENRRHWQKILLREWRNCGDQDYARELFALLGSEPVTWWAPTLAYMLAGALYYGPLSGLGVGFFALGCVGELKKCLLTQQLWAGIAPFVSMGSGLGGAVGLALGVWVRRHSTWGRFVDRLRRLCLGWFVLPSGVLVPLLLFGAVCGFVAGIAAEVGGLLGTLTASLLFGAVSGLLGGLAGVLFVGLFSLPLVTAMGGGLTALLLFGTVGGLATIYTALRAPMPPDQVYERRSILLWWRTRPLAAEVEAALRAVASGPWVELLHRLVVLKGRQQDPRLWLGKLSDQNWQERFLARHALAALGGEAVEPLRAHRDATADWLLKSISVETAQLVPKAASLLCPRCFARCQQHRAPLKRGAITYYGCRLCRQSVEWLEAREAVAVLDSRMTTPWVQRDGLLQVNGLQRGASFDFDRVAIIHATDDAVERFCMQVGNDTDDFRQARYRTVPYTLSCPLEENTKRVLARMFGSERS